MTYWKAVIEALLSLREKVTTFSSACLQLYVQPWCCSCIVNRNHSCPVWICDSSLQWILQRLSDKRFSGVRRIVSRLRKQSYLRTTSILISKLESQNPDATGCRHLLSFWAPIELLLHQTKSAVDQHSAFRCSVLMSPDPFRSVLSHLLYSQQPHTKPTKPQQVIFHHH